MSMSEQPNQTEQSALTPQELRQRMLEELEVSKQVIEEISDEELEAVAGGASAVRISADVFHDAAERFPTFLDKAKSLGSAIFHDKTLQAGVAGASASGLVMGT